jgi:hypothetical protein
VDSPPIGLKALLSHFVLQNRVDYRLLKTQEDSPLGAFALGTVRLTGPPFSCLTDIALVSLPLKPFPNVSSWHYLLPASVLAKVVLIISRLPDFPSQEVQAGQPSGSPCKVWHSWFYFIYLNFKDRVSQCFSGWP